MLGVALAFALFGIVVGAKWATLFFFGSDIPNWDQWDAIAAHLLTPWFEGRDFLAELFQSHNEHYVILTKLQSLGLVLLNGQWDARLECVVNAMLHALTAAGCWYGVSRVAPRRWWLPTFLVLAALFGLPLAWENIVNGFHSQQYWLIGLSLLAIALLPFERTWSAAWWLGAAAAVLDIGSMASGFLAGAVALVLVSFQALAQHRPTRSIGPVVLLGIGLIGVGFATRVDFPAHASLGAHSFSEFFLSITHSLAWPIRDRDWVSVILWLPWSLVTLALLVHPREIMVGRWQRLRLTAVGIGIWVLLQILAAAYARGAGANYPAIRYADTLAIGSVANALCLLCLFAQSKMRRSTGLASTLLNPDATRTCWMGAAWLAVLVFGIHETLHRNFTSELPGQREYYQHAEAAVRRYIVTNDPTDLAVPDIPYPDAATLVERLSHPALRDLMPASIRAPLALQTAKSSAANTFAAGGASPGTAALVHPTWGSFHDGGNATGQWMSEPATSNLGGWLKFETAGQLGENGTTLEIHDAVTGVPIGNVAPSRVAGDNWRAAYVDVSQRPFVTVAQNKDPAHWFAFSAPVEMGRFSYRAWIATKHGLLVLYLSSGLAGLLGLLAFWTRPQIEDPEPASSPVSAPSSGSLLNPSTWRLTWRTILIGSGILCVLLAALSPNLNRLGSAKPNISPVIEGTFTRNGQFPGEPLPYGGDVRVWGSWSGADENTGTLRFGPFPAPQTLRFAVGGYPDQPGIEIFVEHAGERSPLPVPREAVGEKWKVIDCPLPAAWVGTPIVLGARDGAQQKFGWVGISEPVRGGRSDGNNGFYEACVAWTINGILLGIIGLAIFRRLNRSDWADSPWLGLIIGAAVATLGYVAFWIYWADNVAGVLFSVILLAAAVTDLWRHPEIDRVSPELVAPVRLIWAIGFFHLALLYLFPSPYLVDDLGANRYREGLPWDNRLPHFLAARLLRGESPIEPGAEWQSSDRPPLETGWELLTWPITAVFRIEPRTASTTSAIWFQLLWVGAAFGLLRTLGLSSRRSTWWCALLALSGFFIQNTIYTWPKLSAGAFVCGAFGLWVLGGREERKQEIALGSALAALGWLSHGGIAFSLLAAIPWLGRQFFRDGWRQWGVGVGVFLVLALPWLAYQKIYDPPGTRLLKMHLAGIDGLDSRGLWQSLHDSYSAVNLSDWVAMKKNNFAAQFAGDWSLLPDFDPAKAAQRRSDEFFFTGRALTWWALGAIAFPFLLWRRRRDPSLQANTTAYLHVAGWVTLTGVIWCILMWKNTVVHQSSYAAMIASFVLCSAILDTIIPWAAGAVAVLQSATVVSTYAVPHGEISGQASAWPWVILAALVLAGTAFPEYSRTFVISPVARRLPAWWPASKAHLVSWWREPRLTWWLLPVLGVALGLRHPSALHTPQLWAEDGSVFLSYNDLFGLAAFKSPYAGYLHTIPRVVAWTAPHLLDVRWWPAFYNWTAFAICLAIVARTFSPRLKLPGKLWLALAFFLGPKTEEILFNVTNLQWITGLGLVQLALLERPTTFAQRVWDGVVLALIGLTGPFVIILLPLFAWRWWRDRNRDNTTLVLIALVCAAVQGWFLMHAGPGPEPHPKSVALWPILVALGRRLLAWPALGDQNALAAPAFVLGLLAIAMLAGLAWCFWRKDQFRSARTLIAAAFLLMVVACVIRTRPDGWGEDNLYFGERYFYMPGVLLVWLLILEFNAPSRRVAMAARAVGLLMAVGNLVPYAVPAPPDYDWASHCEPIRRGVKASIPTLPQGWTMEYLGRPERR